MGRFETFISCPLGKYITMVMSFIQHWWRTHCQKTGNTLVEKSYQPFLDNFMGNLLECFRTFVFSPTTKCFNGTQVSRSSIYCYYTPVPIRLLLLCLYLELPSKLHHSFSVLLSLSKLGSNGSTVHWPMSFSNKEKIKDNAGAVYETIL